MREKQLEDPFGAFRFAISLAAVGGGPMGGFTDVSGLTAETDVETLREGGVNTGEQQLPGATRFPSRLVLKQGVAHPARLWEWYVQIMAGAITRKGVTITVYSEDKSKKLSWSFRDACPVKWTGPELRAGSSAVAFESIELVHRGFLLADSPG